MARTVGRSPYCVFSLNRCLPPGYSPLLLTPVLLPSSHRFFLCRWDLLLISLLSTLTSRDVVRTWLSTPSAARPLPSGVSSQLVCGISLPNASPTHGMARSHTTIRAKSADAERLVPQWGAQSHNGKQDFKARLAQEAIAKMTFVSPARGLTVLSHQGRRVAKCRDISWRSNDPYGSTNDVGHTLAFWMVGQQVG